MILYSSVFFLCFLLYFLRLQFVFAHPVDHCESFRLLLLSKFDEKGLDDSVFFCISFCVFYCIFTHEETAVVFTHPVDHCQTFKLLLLPKFDKKSLDDSVFFCIFFGVFYCIFYAFRFLLTR